MTRWRVGISLTSNHPDVTDPRQGARRMIERTAAARRAALDSLFVGDQHVSPTPYYQNTPMLGRLLAEWGEAPAGCLFLLPLWHPVAGGRADRDPGRHRSRPLHHAMRARLGASPGSPPWAPTSGRALRLSREALDIVQRLLAGEKVSSSRRFRIARSEPGAASGGPRRGSGSAPAPPPAIDRAARLAEGLDREPRPHPRGGRAPQARTLS